MSMATRQRAAPGGEQPAGQHLDRLRGGPLAHPDQHRPVADDQHVAALDGGRGGFGAVVPDVEVGAGEHRVPAVDGLVVDRLRDPGRAAHRVDRHPAVDPAGGVPLVKQVRQRREHEPVRVKRVEGDALRHRPEFGDLPLGDPAGQVPGQLGRAQPVHRRPQGRGGQRPVPARVEQPVKDVAAGLGDVQGLGQQVAVVVDHHARATRRAAANASCSACARLTHSMSSNSRSATLSGVRRLSSRSGRCRITCRRRPTSESTWNMEPRSGCREGYCRYRKRPALPPRGRIFIDLVARQGNA